jgi:hypothetical protein
MKITLLALLAAAIFWVPTAQAGPGKAAYVVAKTAVYPLHHPKKDMHAGKKVAKATGKVVKTIVW